MKHGWEGTSRGGVGWAVDILPGVLDKGMRPQMGCAPACICGDVSEGESDEMSTKGKAAPRARPAAPVQ